MHVYRMHLTTRAVHAHAAPATANSALALAEVVMRNQRPRHAVRIAGSSIHSSMHAHLFDFGGQEQACRDNDLRAWPAA